MGDYRVYRLDKSGKTTGPPLIVQCEDDDAALIFVRRLADDQIQEIWEGARRVATIQQAGERAATGSGRPIA
jgi:hypothetical protein